MTALLAALSAATFGTGDFLGGLASRRIPAVLATLVVQFVGLLLLLALLPWIPGSPIASDLLLGAASGIAVSLGLTVFYWAMSVGPMGVVAPVTALLNAAVPVLAGLLTGERPSPLSAVGIIVALPAIVLISREKRDPATPSESLEYASPGWVHVVGGYPVLAGAASGVCFGLFFILLSRTSEASGVWPLVGSRACVVVVVSATAALMGMGVPERQGVLLSMAAGCMDVLGNILYLFAIRGGLISLVGVISAMYPASTVVLARVVVHERLQRHQVAGLATAGGAVVLIALGA